MKVFVTGGSGFVGRHLISRLRDAGYEVRALARSPQAADQVRQQGAIAIPGDLFDVPAMTQGMQGCAMVFHVAGFLSIWGKYSDFYQTNVIGTDRTLAAAQTAGVQRFVQIGAAASVLDHTPLANLDEHVLLKQPKFSPYIATKSIAEQRVLAANQTGFMASVVRPSWIWGEGDHVLPQLVHAVTTGQSIWIDQGNYPYMTTHVLNVCHGAILAAERSPGGQAYFLSDGDVVQFRDWVTTLLKTVDVRPGSFSIPRGLAWTMAGVVEFLWRITERQQAPPITRTMVRLIGQELTFSDRKAQLELGYQPIVSRAAGLAKLAQCGDLL